MGKTRFYPVDFSVPEPLNPKQIEATEKILMGFRHLFDLLDDVLPQDAKKDVVDLLAKAKRAADDVVRFHVPRLTLARLVNMFHVNVESYDRRVVSVVMNVSDFASLRADHDFKANFDSCSEPGRLAKGFLGTIFAADLYMSKKVPVGKLVLIDDGDLAEVTSSNVVELKRASKDIDKDWVPAPSQLLEI